MQHYLWLVAGCGVLLAFAYAQSTNTTNSGSGLSQSGSSNDGNAACEQALEYHDFALQTLRECTNGEDSELCQYLGEYLAMPSTHNAENAGHNAAEPTLDLWNIFVNPANNVKPWADFLAQVTSGQTADIGQIAYLATVMNAEWSALANESFITEDQYSGAWGRAWWELADAAFDQAQGFSNTYDWQSKRDLYLKAANYYFAGVWPQPTQPEAQDALSNMRMALRRAFNTWQGATSTKVIYFSVNYTADGNNANGTTEYAQLPGFFITPDASRKLPTAVMATGFDWPKEALFLGTGQALLDRGYAAIYFDGPGQGQSLWSPPHLTFTNDWAGAVSPFLDYAQNQLSQYVDSSRLVLEGLSLGGYLGGRACAGLSDRLAACYISPARTDLTSAYNVTAQYGTPIYGGVQYAAQQNASLLPPGYAQAFSNFSANILQPLLFECTADTRAPEAFAEPIGSMGVVDPDLIYLATAFGGKVDIDSDYRTMLTGLWEGYRRISEFTNPDIANISCPVLNVMGLEDGLLGGQEAAFMAALNPTTAGMSKLITFNASSGAALHNQAGAPIALNAAVFAFLDPILKGNSSAAPVLSAAGRRLHKSSHKSKIHSDLL